jgi:Tol biopolymer transport system component/tRNA A-37 threonylcarbamoyl transferase component Bud32
MSLTPGARLGGYEIVALVGAGGMGEVYRARDPKLQRDVAIKVLPDLFSRDPERLARLEREARTLAALNHPHIAHVYGVEHGALVMEFVDGEDLSQRIARAGAIPMDEALPIAAQIADALECAHERGIVHRDLKPANVKLRPDGTVKVLDFGLAKALEARDQTRAAIENSPTITSPFQLSQLGLILGTAAYMAPEQAKAKPVDKRVDIWAFGCVVYELLTGQRAFKGEDVTDTLAAIVRADPDWTALPPETPATVRTLLRRCLEKNPRERLPDIGAARLELKEARAGSAAPGPDVAPRPRRSWLPWTIAGAAGIAAMVAAGYALRNRPAPDDRVIRFLVVPPGPLSNAPALRLALSPDGRHLAFVAPDAAGNTVLWLRHLDDMQAHPIPDTVNASDPFWSPDSRSIAFVADNELRHVAINGGPVQTVCNAIVAPAGSWNRDNVLIFSLGAGGIFKAPASGGAPVAVTGPVPGAEGGIQTGPVFLPDQHHFLFTRTAAAGRTQSVGIYVGSLDSKEVRRILPVSSNVMFADGHLLYMVGTTLMAQPFDSDALTVKSPAVPIVSGVQINTTTGTGAFSVSQTGVLAYQPGPSTGTQLTWIDRAGKPSGTIGSATGNRDVQISPDGRTVSSTLTDELGRSPNIYLFDIARGTSRRFTFSDGGFSAVWAPDGHRLAYAVEREDGSSDLVEKDVSGTGRQQLLYHDRDMKYPLAFSPDGASLLYAVQKTLNVGLLRLLPLSGDRTPREIVPGDVGQEPAEVSPDGRWMAYVSMETGRREVFVTSFPDAKGKWQVTTTGGDAPRWRPIDGKELYFVNGDRFMAVDVTVQPDRFDFGPARQLFEVHVPARQLGTRSPYAIDPAGQRFLFNTWDAKAAMMPIALVVNWTQVIKK